MRQTSQASGLCFWVAPANVVGSIVAKPWLKTNGTHQRSQKNVEHMMWVLVACRVMDIKCLFESIHPSKWWLLPVTFVCVCVDVSIGIGVWRLWVCGPVAPRSLQWLALSALYAPCPCHNNVCSWSAASFSTRSELTNRDDSSGMKRSTQKTASFIMSLDLHGLQSFQHLPSSVSNCQRLTHSKYYKLLLCPRTFSLWRWLFCAFLSPTPKLTDNLTIDSAKGREFDSLQVSPAFLQPLSRGSIPFERRFSLDKRWKVAKVGEANQKPTLSRLFSDRIQEI